VGSVENEESAMTEYVVGWGSFALINAALANADGRGPLSWLAPS
jgi:hypothetical protein